MGSAAGTSKDVVDELRKKKIKAGLLMPRLFRPFPYEKIAKALSHLKAVCVLDRADSYGGYGPMFMEISSALYQSKKRPALINKIYGLGGRDFMPSNVEETFKELVEIKKGKDKKKDKDIKKYKDVKKYLGVRE
jgi:pyruvate ferredoxin oxidoreductase alpha subunit